MRAPPQEDARPATAGPERIEFLGLPFDLINFDRALSLLAARRPGASFGYVVTPNVQHAAVASRIPNTVPAIAAGWLCLCDSRPLRLLGRLLGRDLPLVTGSDLTARLFQEVIAPGDRIAVICGSEQVASLLRARHPELIWDIFVPPPGTDQGTQAFEACVDFVAGNRARFLFVCLGAPKSEVMCHAAGRQPGATGTALCTGASLEFILGLKVRAPRAIQMMGLEWLHRMLCEPRRLTRRYLSAFLPLARLSLIQLRRDRAERRRLLRGTADAKRHHSGE